MEGRRNLLSAAMTLMGAATISSTTTSSSAAASGTDRVSDNQTKFPRELRGIGLIANEPAAAAANTAALQSLVDPNGNFRGTLWFPNTTGTDVYHFNDIIPFHDGVSLDLQGCVLHFSKVGVRTDTNSGFIFAVRDFSIANGSIVIDYRAGGGATSAGNALTFGNRGEDSHYFSPTYDSLLPSPMGNIVVRNLRISSNAKEGGTGILMTGGLNGVIIENVWIDGAGGTLDNGIYYEFGWATNEPKRELRQTSHAHNLRLSNINISNLNTKRGAALTLAGAYNCWVDGLYVNSANILFSCTPGDSSFFRPWAGVDQAGAKRNIALRNIVGAAITSTAISVAGAWSKSGGYLKDTPNAAKDQVDLIDVSIDGFSIDGGSLNGGYGIFSSAGKLDLRNGRITNFAKGVITTNECTRMTIESVDVIGSAQCAMQLGQQSSIWSPPRQKMGIVRNCFIAGNSVAAPGTFAAIELDLCAAFIIEGNRFGYEAAHDGISETTQGFSVRVGAQANNVICRGNHTGGIHPGGAAYANHFTAGTQGNTIEHSSGIVSTLGLWDGVTGKR